MTEAKSATSTFTANRPEITVADVADAAKRDRVVQSLNVFPAAGDDGRISALAIKWKFSNGAAETILITRHAATVLNHTLSHVEANNWTDLAIIPPDAKPVQ